jgi:glycine dehydrogenase subunit 1
MSFGGPYVGLLPLATGLRDRFPAVWSAELRSEGPARFRSNAGNSRATFGARRPLQTSATRLIAWPPRLPRNHGPSRRQEAAQQSAQKAHYAAREISRLEGFSLPFSGPFFNEFVVRAPVERPRCSIASPRRLLMAASRYHGLILTVRMIFSSAQQNEYAHRLMRSSKVD